MRRTEGTKKDYSTRLQKFLEEIETLASHEAKANPMHAIMDTVPFKDLEIALMMARMEQKPKQHRAA